LQTLERTPIVALTAEGTSGEKNSCLSAGMDDFLTKPLELQRLTEVLHRWLKSAGQVIDSSALEKLRSYVVNNKSLTQALIEDFVGTAPNLVDSMKAALKQKNLPEITQAAHALKSTSATLGATGLAELCKNIEDVDDIETAGALLANIDEQLSLSMDELQKYLSRMAA
jgi:HPt (histidine-containing phosphotransfer) domain-containing protein